MFTLKYQGLAYFENEKFDSAQERLGEAFEIENLDPEIAFFLGSAEVRSDSLKNGVYHLFDALHLMMPEGKVQADIFSEKLRYLALRDSKEEIRAFIKSSSACCFSFPKTLINSLPLLSNKSRN